MYSEEELNEMIEFFAGRELPKSMQINSSSKTGDLAFTVNCCIEQAKVCLGNYKMQGAFFLLKQIRENLNKAAE